MFSTLMKSVEYQTSSDIMLEVAEYISDYMRVKNVSKTEMAKKLSISRVYLHELLCCKKVASLDLIIHIASVLGKRVQIKFVKGGK